jgi:GAF domain-containing protein/HAMP domain-containing protein
MAEEQIVAKSQDTVEQGAQGGQSAVEQGDRDQRSRRITLVILLGAMIIAGTLAFYLLYYFRTGTWQVLVDGAGLVIGLVCLGVALFLARRGNLDSAGYCILLTVGIAYTLSEVAWAGETAYNIVGGILLILILGRLVLHRKWGSWLLTAAVSSALVLSANHLAPIARPYAPTEAPVIYYSDLGLIVLLAVTASGMVIRALRVSTIRTRLVVAFLLITLIPAIITGGVSRITAYQSGQAQMVGLLETVAALKEAEIADWLRRLEEGLEQVLVGGVDGEIENITYADTPEASELSKQPVRMRLFTVMLQGAFEELFLIDPNGMIVVSTARGAESFVGQELFEKGSQELFLQVAPAYGDSGELSVFIARPVTRRGDSSVLAGVLVGRANMRVLNEFMRVPTGMGKTGQAYLLTSEGALLGGLPVDVPDREAVIRSEGIDAAAGARRNVAGLYQNYEQQPVVGVYHWVPDLDAVLVVEQQQSEAFAPLVGSLAVGLGVTAGSVLVAVIASLLVTRSIAGPLSALTETATAIAAGDLERVAKVERKDEVGALAQAFNNMTAQLRDLVGGLEGRVAERTRDLEWRSTYLEASAQVVQAATSILDTGQLIRQVVELIQERFDLYYVGLFLVDEFGEWAVLRAGTGEAGRIMQERGHRIKVGEGMVGWCVAHAQSRVASEVDEDTVRLSTAELPETRSEAALPMRARGEVIGALTVQSTHPAAFDPETIAVFQTMADQMAIAVDNARLFAESQAALRAARRAYGQLSVEAWMRLLQARPDLGFLSSEAGVVGAEGRWRPEARQALETGQIVYGDGDEDGGKRPVAVPIKVRGQVIGVLDSYKPADAGGWTADDLALMESLSTQVGQALESARLYEDTRRRAVREQVTGYIVDKMRRAIDMESLMQTTVEEVANALGASSAFVQVGVGLGAGGSGSENSGQPDGAVEGTVEE